MLDFNKAFLQKRKATATHKLLAMIGYGNNTTVCRSKKIVTYFNEFNSDDCGICDICLLRKKIEMNTIEFEQLVAQIEHLTTTNPLLLEQLVKTIPHLSEEKIVETVRYLLDNDKLRNNTLQQLEWNNQRKK